MVELRFENLSQFLASPIILSTLLLVILTAGYNVVSTHLRTRSLWAKIPVISAKPGTEAHSNLYNARILDNIGAILNKVRIAKYLRSISDQGSQFDIGRQMALSRLLDREDEKSFFRTDT